MTTEVGILRESLEAQRARLNSSQKTAPWEVEGIKEAIANLESQLGCDAEAPKAAKAPKAVEAPKVSIVQKKEAKVKSVRWERHLYYEEHKDEIIADLLSTGRIATRTKWHIPVGASLAGLVKRWLTPEQKASIPRPRRVPRSSPARSVARKVGAHAPKSPPKSSHPDINAMPKFPEFSGIWATLVQVKWLEIWQKHYEEFQRNEKNTGLKNDD